MFFIILTFAAALFIEGLGSLVSVIGISALFGANPIIIALAIALDVGKVVVVSLLYTYWKVLSKLMKSYALLAATVTMVITSAGAAGYLSGEFQKSILGTKEGELKVAVLKEQQAKYQARKAQIDDQIAKLPTRTTVNQRLRLMNGFKAEQKALDEKISQIDKDLPALQVAQIGTEAKAGPIVSISKAFNVPMEEAVTWVIGMIIFVFDPLAIFLIIAGNFLWARRKAERGEFIHPTVPVVEAAPVKVTAEEFHEFKVPSPEQQKKWVDQLEGQRPPIERREVVKPVQPKVEEPTPVVEPVVETPVETEYTRFDAPAVEPEREVTVVEPENRARYVPTGLLKPIDVQAEEKNETFQPTQHFTPMMVPEITPEVVAVEPSIEAGPVTDDLPPQREQITRSSLGLVDPDPSTVVDAPQNAGFRRANSVVKTKR